ncbi:hypothetical protein GHO35_13480 [Pseudomonas helleri]|uniref:hypothetical protein n=1 Tax=Pseudomonas helleri TaxID=1608996 RepID=UPI0012959A3D|nr:hypothetical protein [Pseudomonas helleri]MQU22151.1 hypothetical protein [Pseudomonas helleri]
MSSANNDGKWVWNVLRADADAPFQLSGGQLELDSNGLHLCAGPGHCGGLLASFPPGTSVWREELRLAPGRLAALPGVELVAGEMAAFDLPSRVEIGSINITGNAGDSGAYLREILDFLKVKGF